MSRFLGACQPAGGAQACSIARLPLAGRSEESVGRWSDGHAAFVQTAAAGDAPVCSATSGLVLAGDIRLDNREALFEALRVAHADRASTSDAALILVAYARWGADCATHLLGDFAFAIWDPGARRLFCCCDAYGIRPLFYSFDGKRFLFASAPQLILGIAGVTAKPNHDKFMLLTGPGAIGMLADESWYAGIHFLAGGMTLTVDHRGLRTHRYWEPQEGATLHFRNDDEFREALQPILFDAVRARLRAGAPVTAMLSGGLDSSSIVAVAAMLLERENRSIDVLSVMNPADDPAFPDERAYIETFRAFPTVRIHPVFAQDKGPFSDLDRFDFSHGPLQTSRHYLYTAMVEQCAALGSRAVLDGIGGELGLSAYAHGYGAELLGTLRWVSLWRLLVERRAATGASLRGQIKGEIRASPLPDGVLRALGRKDDISLHGFGIFAPAFAARLARRFTQLRGALPPPRMRPSHRGLQLDRLHLRQRRGMPSLYYNTALETRYPLLDRRLLQFCLDTPASFKIRNGYPRSIARIGLEGLLPPQIQRRVTKTPFSPDYMRRYRRQAGEAVQYLEAIGANDPVRAVIDVAKALALARQDVAEDERDPTKVQAAMH
ncbi:MAG TPA: asparagine synthase-related protein, partial [Rhizomicrobium sp.]